MARMVGRAAIWVAGCHAVLYQAFEHVGFPVQGLGPSMHPTFSVMGDVLFVSRWGREDIRRGDIVCFYSCQYAAPQLAIKRVLALAGDRVHYDDEEGVPRTAVVACGQVWVEGDNAEMSTDSRHYGPIPLALVQGRVTYQLLPWRRAGAVPRGS